MGLGISSGIDISSDTDSLSGVGVGVGDIDGGVFGIRTDLAVGERGVWGVRLLISSIGSTLSMLSRMSRRNMEIAVAAELANSEMAVKRRRAGDTCLACFFVRFLEPSWWFPVCSFIIRRSSIHRNWFALIRITSAGGNVHCCNRYMVSEKSSVEEVKSACWRMAIPMQ